MTRLLSIAALIVALVALGAPSLSLGMGVHRSVVAAADTTASNPMAARPGDCKSLGSKRVLPCHPDLGVMAGKAPFAAPPARYRLGSDVVLPLVAAPPEAELPPPRLA